MWNWTVYWLITITSFKDVLVPLICTTGFVLLVFLLITAACGYDDGNIAYQKLFKKGLWWIVPWCFLTVAWAAIPNERNMLLIVGSGMAETAVRSEIGQDVQDIVSLKLKEFKAELLNKKEK